MSDYLTVGEAAARLGVTPGRVRQYITRGLLPAERHGPIILLIKAEDVEAFEHRPAGWTKGRPRKAPPEGS